MRRCGVRAYPTRLRRRSVVLGATVRVNDLARDLGPLEWAWELRVEGRKLARGSGAKVVPADSVIRLEEARARLVGTGRATLALKLFGNGVDETNDYGFVVTGGSGRGTSVRAR